MNAIIFGVSGMDGSHLADFLLEKGYEVIGATRRSSDSNRTRIEHLKNNPRFHLMEADITDMSSINSVLRHGKDGVEIYNLAAQSHVGTSFKQPGLTWDVTGKGCMNILECILGLGVKTKFYQASSSEMFGRSYDERVCTDLLDNSNSNDQIWEGGQIAGCFEKYQNEDTKFLPQSPYAISKCAAHMSVQLYRQAYGLHASCGILFNHEGPRRGENFVTRKITKWIAEFDNFRNRERYTIGKLNIPEDMIYLGKTDTDDGNFPKLRLGNLDAYRDWGDARDYVRGMWMMLQQEKPDDYVLSTGRTRSVRDFLDAGFNTIGIKDWNDLVMIDPEFYRPAEVDFLLGDSSKARDTLGWKPEITFDQMVKDMIETDIKETLWRKGREQHENTL